MVSSRRSQQHIPNEDELNTAIASVLQENELAAAKDIRAVIMKHHKNWRLPERRVAKFVKRQQQSVMPWEQTDDELSKSSSGSSIRRARSAVSSAVKGTGRGLKKALAFGKSKSGPPDDLTIETGSSTPPSEITTDFNMLTLPYRGNNSNTSAKQNDDDDLLFFTPTSARSSSGTFRVTGLASPKQAYDDDNDGKKESGFCEPCEGCSIL